MNNKVKFSGTPLAIACNQNYLFVLVEKSFFDKILLCRNMEVATSFAKQYQMDCELFEDDLISRKGALTGAYVDSRQSKLAYHRQLAQLRENLSIKEAELEQLQG